MMYGSIFEPPTSAANQDDKLAKITEELGPLSAQRWLANRRDEVRDEQGRRRFHGAFTGGFSAGYFNTVGSAEGWQPKTFASSRQNRPGPGGLMHSVRDYMDDEDAHELLAGSLVAKGATSSGIGDKRGREWEQPAGSAGRATAAPSSGVSAGIGSLFGAASTASRQAAIPGAIPAELISPSTDSAGLRMLQGMGWREGQELGPRKARAGAAGGSSAPSADHRHTSVGQAAGQPPSDLDEAVLKRMWVEGTARSATDRYGLGYDPGSLRQRVAADMGLASRAGQAEAAGTRRLHMFAVLGRDSGRDPGRMYALTDASSGNLLAGDEEGEDDGGAYRSLGMEAYDIASSRVTTGKDIDRQQAKERAALYGDSGPGRPGSHGSGKAGPLALTDKAGPLAIQDATHGSNNGSDGDSKARLCADGRPALPGFHLASRVERGFLDFARSHAPPAPPQGWVPHHVFDRVSEPLPLYAQHGFVPGRVADSIAAGPRPAQPVGQAAGGSAGSGRTPEQQGPKPVAAAISAPTGPMRGQDPLLASRFVKEGEGGSAGAQASSSGPQPSAAGPPGAVSAPLPAIGTTLRRSTTQWAPSRMLLKRLGLPDPLTKADRARLEGSGDGTSAGTAAGGAGSGPSQEEWMELVGKAAAAAGAARAQQGNANGATASSSGPMDLESSSSAGPHGLGPALAAAVVHDATMAPVLAAKPAAAVFAAIFQDDSDED